MNRLSQCIRVARRLCYPMILASQLLVGAGITPISHCTIDGKPLACMPGDPLAAQTSFSQEGLGTNMLDLQVAAGSAAGYGGNLEGMASIEIDFTAITEGPVRPGTIEYYLIVTETDGGGFGEIYSDAQASISGIGSCSGGFCHDSAYSVPFQLGVPFTIKLSAYTAAIVGQGPADAYAFAYARLEIYEWDTSQGSVPVIIVAAPVPEPEPFGLVLLAGAGLVWRRLRQSRGGF